MRIRLVVLLRKIKRVPVGYTVCVAVLAVCIASLLLAYWPGRVELSYSDKTCVAMPVIAPGILVPISDTFTMEPDRKVRVDNATIAAGGFCLKPKVAPSTGEHRLSVALFGVPLLSKQFIVEVKPPAHLNGDKLQKPIPVSKELVLPLSLADRTFTYKITANNKTVPCKSVAMAIACDFPRLGLAQGGAYKMAVERFYDNRKVANLAEYEITTLSAVTVKSASIQNDELIYSRPKVADFILDKPVKTGKVSLTRIDGDKRDDIPVEAIFNDTKVSVSWHSDLSRQVRYELILQQVEAVDGSGLVDRYVVPFRMSGGPKVKSVSVGTSKVALGSSVVLAFDQPLLGEQDIGKAILLTGGATITAIQGANVHISFANVPKCNAVTIRVTDALKSSFDVTGGSAWQYATRTICHTVGSIGSSVKGRAISAYYFGNGPNVVIYTGAIHGNEPSTRALMLRWVDELEANAGSIPADKTIVVVPAINPDGDATGARTNANNVDLNRNFGTTDWRKDITTVTNAPFPGGGGAAPMSEPEVRAIAALVGRMRPQLVVSYHSIGSVVIANQVGGSSGRAATYVGLSGYGNATGSSTTFEYAISGTADDYYGEKLGIPSIVIELGSHSYHQFERNQKAMWAMLR